MASVGAVRRLLEHLTRKARVSKAALPESWAPRNREIADRSRSEAKWDTGAILDDCQVRATVNCDEIRRMHWGLQMSTMLW
jgi:hypothetical protein